ncbi:thiamine pyrophosphate-binding protein [Cohnella caldifontis]|uniref:thiamine pyrophosphate-binding protein n=1 Tax=Cohnella caldifontis TaxID=3027471 RepID=UPI0023ED050E|nr:thiamine pyrophosphate-binding protein [Cohnella sp. YIM B05605]
MKSKSPSVAGVILSQMSLWGIRNIYGVAGDAIIPLLDALQHQDAIRYIAARHESAAAFMASAEGKCTSRIGACIGTSGPGLANMLNGVADAAADRVPMLVVTGQVKTDQVGTEAKQYVEQQQLISPLAVFSASLLHPDAALTVLNRAIIEAIRKQGVAHISVPKDVLALPCHGSARAPTGLLQHAYPVNLSQMDLCIDALNAARKPMVYIGQGSRNAAVPIRELAEKLSAGIIETLGAKGTIPADHELHIGGIGVGGTEESAELLKLSDCLLIIGANWYPDTYVPRETRVIKIDTAPGSIESQQDITFGLVGDAAEVVRLLIPKITHTYRSEWLNQVKETKSALMRRLDRERRPGGRTITPQALMAALETYVAPDGIIALDTGDHTIWFNRIFRAQGQSVLFSGKWRTMGFGLPGAISAKLHFPNKEVTALAGDGSFLMTSMELSTVVKYQTPIKIIVANNGTLAAEQSKMAKAGIQPYGVDLTNPDFSLLARAFGIKGIKVRHLDELEDALREAYTGEDQAVLADVHVTDSSPLT